MPVMPDTRIAGSALGGGGDQGGAFGGAGSFMGTLGSMMKIKEQALVNQTHQREVDKAQRDEEDDLETRSALQRHERPEEAIQELWKGGRSAAATKLAASVYNERKAQSDAYDAKLKETGSRLETAAQMLQGVGDDASYQPARRAVAEVLRPIYGDGIEDALPTVYDKTHIESLVKAGTARANYIQQEQNLVRDTQNAWSIGLIPNPDSIEFIDNPDGTKTKNPKFNPNAPRWSPNGQKAQDAYRDNLNRALSTAENEEQYNTRLKQAREAGYPEEVLKSAEPWNPKAPEHAMRRGMTIPQEVTAISAGDRNETADKREERLEKERIARGGGGNLTSAQDRSQKAAKQNDIQELDKWWHKQHDDENPGEIDKPYDVRNLGKAGQGEYVRRRIEIEDNDREIRGRPSLIEEAQAAAASGDVGAYENVRRTYNNLTRGLPHRAGDKMVSTLEEIVPPPGTTPKSTRVPTTPLDPQQEAARKRGVAIVEQLKTEKRPQVIAQLQAELQTLLPRPAAPTSAGPPQAAIPPTSVVPFLRAGR